MKHLKVRLLVNKFPFSSEFKNDFGLRPTRNVDTQYYDILVSIANQGKKAIQILHFLQCILFKSLRTLVKRSLCCKEWSNHRNIFLSLVWRGLYSSSRLQRSIWDCHNLFVFAISMEVYVEKSFFGHNMVSKFNSI